MQAFRTAFCCIFYHRPGSMTVSVAAEPVTKGKLVSALLVKGNQYFLRVELQLQISCVPYPFYHLIWYLEAQCGVQACDHWCGVYRCQCGTQALVWTLLLTIVDEDEMDRENNQCQTRWHCTVCRLKRRLPTSKCTLARLNSFPK